MAPKPTRAPPAAGRALTGRPARAAVAGLASGSSSGTRAAAWMDEYSRARAALDEKSRAEFDRMMRLLHQIFGVPAMQAHKLFIQDQEFRQRMAQRTDLAAINWRAADRDWTEARAWLDQARDEPARRFKARDEAERRLKMATLDHQRWHDANPEPPKRLWQTQARTLWESAAKSLDEKLDAAKSLYRIAFQRADLAALDALDKERKAHERRETRALNTRQSLALMPSEEYLRDLQAAATFPSLPADAPTSEPDLKTEIGSAATANPTHRRWRREMSPRPPR